jgi:DNA-binding PucR family transcriptional regulator
VLDSSEVQDTPGHAVHHLFRDLGDLVRELPESIHGLLIEQVAELAADQQLKELLSDTVAANVDTWFSVVRHSIPFDRMESPTAALEHARRMAQREVPVNALLRAYRLGHQYGLNLIIAGLRSADLPPEEKLALIEHITRVSFRYIDWMSEQVLETYQTERAEWDESRRSLRAQAIREILDGRDVDLTEASSAMRYFLGATHVALMVWLDRDAGADTDEFIAMERFMQHAVSATGAKQSVYFSIDRLVGCAWMTVHRPSDHLSQLRDFVRAQPDGPRLSVGEPLPGIEGFRRTYRQAEQARVVAMAADGSSRHRIVAARDPGVALASMLMTDDATLKEWIHDVLGPLAQNTASDQRLRDTLRVFLRAGSSFKAAANELQIHANTVKYRVNRALERRGRPIAAERLDVEVALLMCYWLGEVALNPTQALGRS